MSLVSEFLSSDVNHHEIRVSFASCLAVELLPPRLSRVDLKPLFHPWGYQLSIARCTEIPRLWSLQCKVSATPPCRFSMPHVQDSPNSDAKVNNFILLEPSLRLLGVAFDAQIAFDIIEEAPGTAGQLLYQVHPNSQFRIGGEYL